MHIHHIYIPWADPLAVTTLSGRVRVNVQTIQCHTVRKSGSYTWLYEVPGRVVNVAVWELLVSGETLDVRQVLGGGEEVIRKSY